MLTDDVGGAFGLKTGAYPDYMAIMVAAKVTGRPVHWMSTRSEAFLSDGQARDTFSEAELALDERGAKFLTRCASATSATWAPISARSAPTSRR